MKTNHQDRQRLNFVCFRCGRIMTQGEKMMNLSLSLDTPGEDNIIEGIESTAISTLCFGCASVLLAESIILDSSLVMPQATETRESVITEDEFDDSD